MFLLEKVSGSSNKVYLFHFIGSNWVVMDDMALFQYKDRLCRYGSSDKYHTVVRPSYFFMGSYTGKTAFLYCEGRLMITTDIWLMSEFGACDPFY